MLKSHTKYSVDSERDSLNLNYSRNSGKLSQLKIFIECIGVQINTNTMYYDLFFAFHKFTLQIILFA